MVDYWECRRGIKKGEVLNPAMLLYRSYVKWLRSNCPDDSAVSYVDFAKYLEKRGYQRLRVRNLTCWKLNKYIVPWSANPLQVR